MVTITAILLALLAMNVNALAQRHGRGMEQHEKNLENLRMLKLLEILELDDEQNDRFIGIFSSFRKETREIKGDIDREIDALSELLKDNNTTEKQLQEKIEIIEKLQAERCHAAEKFFKRAAEILTTEQLAKMVIFKERFEKRILETIRGFRGRFGPSPDSPFSPSVPGENDFGDDF
jgi:Spy/CpxP family protein refolding chaperone